MLKGLSSLLRGNYFPFRPFLCANLVLHYVNSKFGVIDYVQLY